VPDAAVNFRLAKNATGPGPKSRDPGLENWTGQWRTGPRSEVRGPSSELRSFLLLFVYCHAMACHTMSFRSFINVNEMLLPALAHSSLQLRFYCSDLLCFLAGTLELATICRRVNTTQSKVATRPSCSCPHISLMHS